MNISLSKLSPFKIQYLREYLSGGILKIREWMTYGLKTNIKIKILFSSFCLIMLAGDLHSQDQDSILFTKGTMLSSLFGNVTNQQIDIENNQNVTSIGYSIGTKSGYFFSDNYVSGLNFSLSRQDFENENLALVSENLVLGILNRYYFVELESAALHFELSPYFTSIHQENTIQESDGLINSDRIITGKGYGIETGFGFTFMVNRNIGFGIDLTYSWTRLNVDTEDLILSQITSEEYNVDQLGFSFSFQVFMDEFFF